MLWLIVVTGVYGSGIDFSDMRDKQLWNLSGISEFMQPLTYRFVY